MRLTAKFMTRLGRAAVAAILLAVCLATASAAQDATQEVSSESPQADARALIEVLRDPAARDALIAELERLGTDATPADPPTEEEEDPVLAPLASAPMSIGRQIAQITQAASEDIAENAQALWQRLQDAPGLLDGLSGREVPVLVEALRELLIVIASTVVTFFVLRWIAERIYRRLGASAQAGNTARTVLFFGASAVIDVAVVLLSWAVGYLLALLIFGEFGQIAIRQTLYLNAFLLVELAKVVARLILSPASGALRPLPIGDRAARYLGRWLGFTIGFLGYGNLLIVPIINENVGFVAGRATASLIALIVLGIAVYLVLRNRKAVARWILGDESEGRRTGSFASLARRWHWFALLYLVGMFVILLSQPGPVVFIAFAGSGKIALAVLIALSVSKFLTAGIAHGVTLPERVRQPLPLLESRLNRFVPRALFVVRALMLIFVAAYALDVMGLFDIEAWLASRLGLQFTGTLVSVAFVLIVSFLLWLALNSWVDYRLNPEVGAVATSRETTLLTLLRNAVTIALVVITLMFVLAEIGLDIAPLLASAGVLGLAIGFGAQRMVQDIITGIFIQFESAINVGDVITVMGTTGVVERLTIRSVSLRDLHGTFHIVPFSSVDMVSNYMRGYAFFVADIGVAYREDVDEAREAMVDAFEELKRDETYGPEIRGDFEWFGVQAFGESSVDLRARIKTAPGKQWGVGRAYNEIVKRLFDARGIEIPFPHRTLVLGENKDGTTQAIRLADAGGGRADTGGRTAPSDAMPESEEAAE